MKNKLVVSLLVIVIVLILLYQVDVIRYFVSDALYFLKAHETYVSMVYSMNVEKSLGQGKDYVFWGSDKKTGDLKYVYFAFRRGIFTIDGSKGISYSEVSEIASQYTETQYTIGLALVDLYSSEKDIFDYLYWVIDEEDVYAPKKYLRFADGVEEDPWKD